MSGAVVNHAGSGASQVLLNLRARECAALDKLRASGPRSVIGRGAKARAADYVALQRMVAGYIIAGGCV